MDEKKRSGIEGQVTHLYENRMPRVNPRPRPCPQARPVEADIYVLEPTKLEDLKGIIENDFKDVWVKKTKSDELYGNYFIELDEGEYTVIADLGNRGGFGSLSTDKDGYVDVVKVGEGKVTKHYIKRHDIVY